MKKTTKKVVGGASVLLLLFVAGTVVLHEGDSEFARVGQICDAFTVINEEWGVRVENQCVNNATTKGRTCQDSSVYELQNVSKTVRVCSQVINFASANRTVSSDFKCSDTLTGVECDFRLDSNFNGVCDGNGGETCVKIENDSVIYRNSADNWDSPLKRTTRLEVYT